MQRTVSLQESERRGISATTVASNTTTKPLTITDRSMKRSSPSSPLHEPPSSKKRTLESFTKITLPNPFPAASMATTPLRRTISEPIYTTTNTTTNAPFSPLASSTAPSGHFLNTQVQENTKMTSSLSPLIRSISDPTSLALGLPTRNSPSSQRLEKMKSFIKGISQWCDQLMHEDEDEDEDEHQTCENDNKKDSSNIDCDGNEEGVSVEKDGDRVKIHCNCPCGNGYEILLAGNNCYYKLM